VAAQARERGIPAVVAVRGALRRIRAGDELVVDGDAGYVLRL
jgi:phosphohistidine swiveling domain-containing protein